MQKIILNIGLNVDGVPAFTPAFALKALGREFTVLAHEVVTSGTEQTVVALVASGGNDGDLEWDAEAVFNLSADLFQQCIAWAYEANVDATGTLTGPEAHAWDGGKFKREFFVTYEEAKAQKGGK